MANPIISVEATQLWKAGRIEMNRAVNLQVGLGDIIVLVGRTGSGKTTLLDLLSAYETPDGGWVQLRFPRQTISFGRVKNRRRQISPRFLPSLGLGRSFQTPPRLSLLTIPEVWSTALNFLKRPRDDYETANKLLAFLENSGVALGKPGRILPFGHRKLFSVCLALLVGNKITLLDEPLAGLSQTLCLRLTGLIENLHHSGRTIVIAEHRIGANEFFTSRAIQLWPENP